MKKHGHSKSVTSFTVSTSQPGSNCIVCKRDKHPLYNLCLNCLKPGHYVNSCTSQQRCRKCNWLHHTLLHIEPVVKIPQTMTSPQCHPPMPSLAQPVASYASTGLQGSSPLITCHIQIDAPDGSKLEHYWTLHYQHHLYQSVQHKAFVFLEHIM